MATEKWIAGSGVGLTWTLTGSTTTLDTLASSNAILTSSDITNGTALDIFADISLAGGSITVAQPAFVGVYLYPLNADGSTYGDGRFGSAALGPPPSNYYVGSLGTSTGAAVWEGTITGVVIPPGTFRLVVHNNMGAAFAGSGTNFVKYRTYNRSIV